MRDHGATREGSEGLRTGSMRGAVLGLAMLAMMVWVAAGPASPELEPVPVPASRERPRKRLGFNLDLESRNFLEEPAWVSVLKGYAPGILRYPGGAPANLWDWDREGFVPSTEGRYGGRQDLRIPLASVSAIVKAVSGEMILVLNPVTSTLESQLRHLEASLGRGDPIAGVEISNEPWDEGPETRASFPGPGRFGEIAVEWVRAIRARLPGLRVGVPLRVVDHGVEETGNWNREVAARFRAAGLAPDAWILHVYAGSGIPPGRTLAEREHLTSKDAASQRTRMGQKGVVQNALGTPSIRVGRIDWEASAPDGLDIWVTETNMFQRGGAVVGSWYHGLFAARLMMELLAQERVKIVLLHGLGGPRWFSAISSPDPGSHLWNDAEPRFLPSVATACGLAAARVLSAARDADQVQAENLNAGPGSDGLVAWRITTGADTRFLVLNLSDSMDSLGLETWTTSPLEVLTIWDQPHRQVEDGMVNRATATIRGSVALPAWSLSEVSLHRSTQPGTPTSWPSSASH